MQQLDVFISVKPKPRQPVQSIIIKSIEQNMQCMYQARMCLLEYSALPMLAMSLDAASPSGERGVSPGAPEAMAVIAEHPEVKLEVKLEGTCRAYSVIASPLDLSRAHKKQHKEAETTY